MAATFGWKAALGVVFNATAFVALIARSVPTSRGSGDGTTSPSQHVPAGVGSSRVSRAGRHQLASRCRVHRRVPLFLGLHARLRAPPVASHAARKPSGRFFPWWPGCARRTTAMVASADCAFHGCVDTIFRRGSRRNGWRRNGLADDVATNKQPGLQPYDRYKHHVVAGAREANLPEDYVRGIESVVFTVDPLPTRTEKELRAYLTV